MAGSLLEVRKKIGAVQNTSKITKAMQLVAASKMRQFQKRALGARHYAWDLFEILENILHLDKEKQQEEDEDEGFYSKKKKSKNIYTEERKSGKTLFVLYTSDKGLCGPLNNKLINALFKSEKWISLKHEDRLLITIGKKSYSYCHNHKIPVLKKFIGLPEKISNFEMIKVIDTILEYWTYGAHGKPKDEFEAEKAEETKDENQIKEVLFIVPHYKNSFTFYPVMKRFLPLNHQTVQSNLHISEDEKREINLSERDYMIFSPNKEHVIQKLQEFLIQGMFIQAFLELKASEYSSRMIAMQNATDSANKIINELRLTYNKARQQTITQEIAELIGASMALAETE